MDKPAKQIGSSEASSVEDFTDEQWVNSMPYWLISHTYALNSLFRFLEIFKISRTVFMYLYDEIKGYLSYNPRYKHVAPMKRLACSLQVLASDLRQTIVRQNTSICPQSTVSKSINKIMHLFEEKICPKWIQFPTTEVEIAKVKQRFFEETGLKNVIGYVACLSVNVQTFRNNQERFGNANGVQAINVQLVSSTGNSFWSSYAILQTNAQLFRFVTVTWKYSPSIRAIQACDIWSVSTEKDELERAYRNGTKNILLAGSDYPLEPWLITPYPWNAYVTDKQMNFNRKHALARARMSKCLNILQNKFEVLQVARYPPEKMTKIVNACCALYNIAMDDGCFDDLSNGDLIGEEQINQRLDGYIDGPAKNPYFNVGSQVRNELMMSLSG